MATRKFRPIGKWLLMLLLALVVPVVASGCRSAGGGDGHVGHSH